ncbi:uncharacterized protein LOC134718112 [Mytilus trossulus]|uniref:uncharacterized protein LOC134718112 n=1 Tax=Mytilus trossulus TaxID=6551 RepID=UPI003006B928
MWKYIEVSRILFINIVFFSYAYSDRYCFSCQDNSNLASCTRVITCGTHEECYIEKIIADDGVPYFNQGCRDRQICQTTPLGRRSDTVACNQCCDSDFCNYRGCNEQGINADHYNHLCLSCGNSKFTADNLCHKVGLCAVGHKCSVVEKRDFNGKQLFQFGCKSDSECASIQNPNICNKCCTGPFCNYKCSSGSSNIGSLQTPSTTQGWNVVPVMPKTTPTYLQPAYSKNITSCFSCKDISSPADCTEFTHCGVHEQCYTQKSVTSDGNVIFSGDCSPKTSCYSSNANQLNTVICHECCKTNFCNVNGCGHTVSLSDESHFCATCQGVKRPEDCKKVSRCTADQICMIKQSHDLNGQITLNMGCVRKDMCSSIPSAQCSGCCIGAYCNTNCQIFNQHRSNQLFTNPTITTQAPLLAQTTTQVRSSVRCYSCEFVIRLSECQNLVNCNSGETCQLKEFTGSNNLVAYRMKCANEKTCWVAGPHARAGCCKSEGCNNNADILH